MADAPFIITTELDLAGITAGLAALQQKLATFKAPIINFGVNTSSVTRNVALVDQYGKALGQATMDGEKLVVTQGRLGDATSRVAKSTKEVKNAMGDVARRVFVWGSMSAVIFGALQNMRQLYDQTVALNREMGELRIVFPKSTDFGKLKDVSINLAVQYGTEPMKALNILRQFGQAGLDAADAVNATKVAMLGLNTTGAETEQVFNALVSANNLFGVSYDKMSVVMDKIQRLQADFAVGPKDLIDALTAVGPAVQLLNGDIDDLLSNIAAMAEVSRISGKEASNALKHVFSRMVSQEGISALQAVGINIYETANSYRTLRSVLEDIGNKWDTLSDSQKTNLTIALAQSRQYPKLAALFQNFGRQQEALEKSVNASHDAFVANAEIMATWEKQSQIASNRIFKLGEAFISAKGGIADSMVSLKTVFADVISGVSSFLGNMQPLSSGALWVAIGGGILLVTKFLFGIKTAFFTSATASAAFSVAARESGKSVLNLGNVVQFSATKIGGLIALFSLAAAAATFFAMRSEQANRVERARAELLENTITQLSEYNKKLREMTAAGTSNFSSIQNIVDVLQTLDDLTKKGQLTSANLASTLTGMFKGLGDGVDVEKLTKIAEQLKDIEDQVVKVAMQPVESEIANLTGLIKGSFNEAINDAKNGIDVFASSITTLRNSAAKSDLGVTELDMYTNKFVSFVNTIRSGAGVDLLPTSMADFNTETVNSLKSLEQLFSVMKDLNLQMDAIKSGSQGGMLSPERTTALTEAQNKYGQSSKQAGEELYKLIGAEKILKDALGKTGEALNQSIILGQNAASEKTLSDMADSLITVMIDEAKAASLADDKIRLLTEGLRTNIQAVKDAISAYSNKGKGIAAIDINVTALLAAIKNTTAALVKGAETQIAAIKEVNRASKSAGVYFDINKASLNAIDNTISSLQSNISANATEVATLQAEYATLVSHLKEMQKYALKDSTGLQDIRDKLADVSVRLVTQLALQKLNLSQYERAIGSLTRQQQLWKAIEVSGKAQSETLKNEEKYYTSILNSQVEINRVKSGDDSIAAYKKNEEVFKRIFELRLKTAQEQGVIDRLTKEELQLQAQTLTQEEQIAAVQRKQEAYLTALTKAYGRVDNAVSSVKSSFTDLLGNQEEFFNVLQQRGSALELFRKGVSGIAQAMTQSDAETIARYLSEKTRSMFTDVITDVKVATDNIASQYQAGGAVYRGVTDAFISSAAIAKKELEAGFIAGADGFITELQKAIPGLVTAIDAEINRVAQGNTMNMPGATTTVVAPSVDSTESLQKLQNVNDYMQKSYEIQIEALRTNAEQMRSLISVVEPITPAVENSNSKFGSSFEKSDDKNKALQDALVRRLGTMLSQALVFSVNKNANPAYVGLGSDLGSIIGQSVGGPVGSVIGGSFGSLLGSLFGSGTDEATKQTEQLQKIERNTAQLVDRLSAEIINAPAGFSLPAGQGFGGGVSIVNHITVNGDNASAVAESLETQLNDLYSRSNKSLSILR